MFFPRVQKKSDTENEDANDIEVVLSPSPFFEKHGDKVIWVRDSSVIALYFILIVVVFLSTWIKAQSGEFPFNIKSVARRVYSEDSVIHPFFVFTFIFMLFLFSVALRMICIGVVENSIGGRIETHMHTNGHIRKIKKI